MQAAGWMHLRIFSVMAPRFGPSKALRRQHISYRMQPKAQTSVFGPYAFPYTMRLGFKGSPVWKYCGQKLVNSASTKVAMVHSTKQSNARYVGRVHTFKISGDM